MPIEAPDLDDLRYERIRELLISRIPVHAPEWTNHNAGDPGIALIELFSWMTDQLGYRLNQVPDRAYVEFLKLIGIRLAPARAATTTLAFFYTRPETAERVGVPAGSTVQGTSGDRPLFETDTELDAVPAQLRTLITTRADDLRDLADPLDPLDDDDAPDTWLDDRFALLWDGKAPKIHELPSQPIEVGEHGMDPTHTRLWMGFVFNPAPAAQFLGHRVTLTVQLDDDEQPDSTQTVRCGDTDPEITADDATYTWYRPRQGAETEGRWLPLRVRTDTTQGWTRSGTLTFEVPAGLGPIPNDEYRPVRRPPPLTMQEICEAATMAPDDVPPEPVEHPLPGALPLPITGLSLDVPISGWIGVRFPTGHVPGVAVRAITFNVAPATHASTVTNELITRGTGRPGQTVDLAHGNVLADTLQLAIEDLEDALLHDWTPVETFDGSGPDARVFHLDPESGRITFGDGRRGKPPPLEARIIALGYRHGGGTLAPVEPGTVTKTVSVPSALADATNLVLARGGQSSETLEEARLRAPQELKVRGRAVTAEDFEFLTRETPTVNVARAFVVPLSRPFEGEEERGLDLSSRAPGALSVVVVPELPGAYPRPTAGSLREVCRWLDRHRLVTTEVHVVPPMYVRLFDWTIRIVADAGYSTALLRETLAEELGRWLHARTGADGEGVPFGWVLPHSAIVAHLLGMDGVVRVDALECWFDGRAPAAEDGTPGEWLGRAEREVPQKLTVCPGSDNEVDTLELAADELPFVDASTLLLEVTR